MCPFHFSVIDIPIELHIELHTQCISGQSVDQSIDHAKASDPVSGCGI